MDINDVRALITLATFLAYLGVCWWAYRRTNRERFEEDARMPFAGEVPAEASPRAASGADDE